MASSAATPGREEVREFIRKSEETLAEAGKRWTQTLHDFAPGDGSAVRKIVDDAFDFAEKLLKNQREFAFKMIDRFAPESAPKKAPAKKAAKKAA